MRLPDSETLAGTTTTRKVMATRGLVFLVAGLILLGLGFAGVPAGLLFTLVGLVCTYLGVYRLLWAWRRRRVDLLVCLAGGWMTLLILLAIFASVLPLGEPEDASKLILSGDGIQPYLKPFEFSNHLLGTNGNGLDLLARAIFGARVSLVIAFFAVLIGLVVGGSIGVFAGYYRKAVDRTASIFTNTLLAVPPLILLMAISSVLDPTVRNMAFALSLLTIPTFIRMARANTIAYSQREFVTAARALGASRFRVMARELVPNVALPLVSMAVVVASGLIVAEASLSFLGLGIPAPEPTWGNMIFEVMESDTLENYPFMMLVPGSFLFLTVFSLNLLGERAQKRWDTRSAKL